MPHYSNKTTPDEAMSPQKRTRWVLLSLSTLLVSAGCTVAVSFAFRNRVAVVFVGLASFVVGYRILQRARHGPTNDSAESGVRGLRSADPSWEYCGAGNTFIFTSSRYALQAIGIFAMGLGITTFAQTVIVPSLTDAIVSGLYSLAGYVCTHIAINFELL